MYIMIVKFKEKYQEQIWSYLDKENKDIFLNSFFKTFLFVEKGIVKGWVLLQPSKDRLLIDWIFVLDEYRKQKIGTQLLIILKNMQLKKDIMVLVLIRVAKLFGQENSTKIMDLIKLEM